LTYISGLVVPHDTAQVKFTDQRYTSKYIGVKCERVKLGKPDPKNVEEKQT